MLYRFLILAFILMANYAIGQSDFCKDCRTGVFQFEGYDGGVYTIIRTDSNQFERNSKHASHSYVSIKWIDDCEYILFDGTEYKWGEAAQKDSSNIILHNIIYKFEQPDKYFVKTYMPGFPDTAETIFHKWDTSGCYNNIFQGAAFAEYKNAKVFAQTLLGEIHTISYYRSKQVKNKYLLCFEKTYQAEKLNWSKLLDSMSIYIQEGQSITNANCRFKGEYDDEIVAVYTADDENKEANILKAFRCNRETATIEAVDIHLVQYKEADRKRIKW